MKKIFAVIPAWTKVLVYFLLLWSATIVAGTVPVLNDFTFFLAVSVLMSWLFLKWDNKKFWSLGVFPSGRKDALDFFLGLCIGGLMLLFAAAITFFLTKDAWSFNTHVDGVFLVMTFVMCLWSAFVQEFVFRGYPFQTLLAEYRAWIAQLLIAIPFGLMHLHHGMSMRDIITIMLSTGIGSVLFGLAYTRTGKLMLPIGIHLGWNYLQALIPRTAGGGAKGLIVVPDSHTNYGVANVVLPYFGVMAVSIAILFIWRRTFNSHRGTLSV